jgi:hypothetical protein
MGPRQLSATRCRCSVCWNSDETLEAHQFLLFSRISVTDHSLEHRTVRRQSQASMIVTGNHDRTNE